MNYSLGNMLSGGGALNPDGLALDLAFAADKTLTARKGPTPTFTRGSTATFVGSNGLIQSAAVNTPRFDHNPVTLASRGLLIEEQRTNSVLHSENFTNAAWVPFGSTVTSITSTNPSGGSTSHKISENSSNTEHGIFISMPTSGTVTLSAFVKQDGRRFCYLRRDGSSNAVFDLTLGTVTQVTGGGSASIFGLGNGWWRISFTTTEVGNWVIKLSNVGTGVINSLAYQGDGSSGILIWGAQLEVGSFPTSYIPTTTAALTRSADVCSITGVDFTSFYNPVEGSVAVSASSPASGNRAIVGIDDNTANEMIRLRTEGGDPFYRVTDGGSDVVALDLGSVTANASFKIASAYASNNFAASLNGGAASTDSVGTLPTVDRLRIGADQGGNTITGTIGRISYYKKRLPNAKLQTLST